MPRSWFKFSLLLVATASASAKSLRFRQDGPVDPGIPSDCTYFDTATAANNNCKYFEDTWALSHADFVSYNPSVKQDCSGLQIGHSYCVEVNNGLPRPTTTTPTTTSTPTTTQSSKPSPTQDGIIDSCRDFYKAVSGDTCDKIVAKYGTFTFQDFLKWNPAVGSDCTGLWANTYYCVGIPGTPTSPPATTTTPGNSKPSPTQDGLAKDCTTFYKAVSGDTCDKIVNKYGTFTFQDFLKWNPAVGSDCSSLQAGTYYCVGVPGTPTQKPSTTSTTKPTDPSKPNPTQDGLISSCNRFYKAKAGDTCAKIVDAYGTFTVATFIEWNPAVHSDCSGLWADTYYCVGIPGTPTTRSTSAKPPTETCNPGAPQPVQPGTICHCKKWHNVKDSSTTCDAIIKYEKISADNFYRWNPKVGGKTCKGLWVGYNVCVGV